MSKVGSPIAANYTVVNGVQDILIPAEQVIGFFVSALPAGGTLSFYDGSSALITSPNINAQGVARFNDLPLALINKAGLRVVTTDASFSVLVFWL